MKKQYIKIFALVVVTSVVVSLLSVFTYRTVAGTDGGVSSFANPQLPVNYANYIKEVGKGASPVDFTFAAKTSVDAVVHIKTKTKERVVENRRSRQQPPHRGGGSPFDDFFDFFDFGPQMPNRQVVPESRASGSGVLISADGYIVTNNHVVDGADEIKVTLSNKKSFNAKVIGKDASTDVAVLKIEGKNLPYLVYGNSEDVQVGQWVLAIGYPLFLDVTVTAGIVSAKSRSIGINAQQASNLAVEAFIQTDAAVNRGNSGGALVNTSGELIGINSAIASPTGYYSGYSYAVPSNLVKKVAEDIIKFGSVQRAFLGISYLQSDEELPAELAKKYPHYKAGEGVLVRDVASDGAAKAAGIKEGDIILKIGDVRIIKGAQLVEQISKYHPGDKIMVTYKRAGKEQTVSVLLKSQAGTYGTLKYAKLGADFENLSDKQATEYRVKGGVIVKKVGDGILGRQTRIRAGFIITRIENKEIRNVQDLQNVITASEHLIQIEGFYPDVDGRYFYQIDLSATADGEAKK